jgi:putative tricarboxylic transport membrane protein
MMATFGIILSCIGIDPIVGSPRMTFNILQLWDGIDLVPIAMGIFGIGEILVNIEESATAEILKTKIKNIFPSLADWMQSIWSILRGTVLGFFLGIIPGGGGLIASFASYAVEKKVSKTPEKFGKGAIEGVAGPESANNAGATGAFIPLFTLGIPTNIVMGLLFGALLIHGMQPGPLLLKEHPEIFWGLVSSMYLGNVMLLVLNLPLIPLWVRVLKIPYRILFPLIVLFCLIGAYSLKNGIFEVVVMIIFGIVGYLFRKFNYDGAPLLLALVLGPLFEINLRQSLLLSEGSFLIFFSRPISAVAVSIAIIIFTIPVVSYFIKRGKASHH